MAALPDLVAWRNSLFAARLRGVRSVRDSDGSFVQYGTDAEMAAAIAAADRAIAEHTTGRPVLSIKFNTSKGL